MTTLAHNPACNTACRVCHYKDLDYPAQLARKQSWARAKLARWSDVLREIVPAPEADRLQYRSKSWMRSQVGDDGSLSFGWFRGIQVQGKWRDEFVSWDTCPIQTAAIQEMICRLRQVLATQAPEFARNSLTGVWLGSPHVVVVARQPISEEVKKLDWQAILTPPFDRVWFHRNPQIEKKVFSKGGSIEALAPGPEVEALHPVRAFRQVATTLLARARRLAVESLLAHQPVLVVDLYCGTGALSGLLPSNVGWLGIEQGKEMVAYAKSLRPGGAVYHDAFAGSVAQRLRDPGVLGHFTRPYALYLNPPRSGLGVEARELLLDVMKKNRPAGVVYLSCSASSLARDLESFEDAGYRPRVLQPFDFFPQTEHFETLAVMESVWV